MPGRRRLDGDSLRLLGDLRVHKEVGGSVTQFILKGRLAAGVSTIPAGSLHTVQR